MNIENIIKKHLPFYGEYSSIVVDQAIKDYLEEHSILSFRISAKKNLIFSPGEIHFRNGCADWIKTRCIKLQKEESVSNEKPLQMHQINENDPVWLIVLKKSSMTMLATELFLKNHTSFDAIRDQALDDGVKFLVFLRAKSKYVAMSGPLSFEHFVEKIEKCLTEKFVGADEIRDIEINSFIKKLILEEALDFELAL